MGIDDCGCLGDFCCCQGLSIVNIIIWTKDQKNYNYDILSKVMFRSELDG